MAQEQKLLQQKLQQQTLHTPLFSLSGQTHWAKCVKCYDADSIHIVILFQNKFVRFRCRLQGIDTAELRSKNSKERSHAAHARDWLVDTIYNRLIVVTCGDFDKYGRLLVTVHLPESITQTDQHVGGGQHASNTPTTRATSTDLTTCRHINRELVHLGFAYSYDGGKRQRFEMWCNNQT